MQREAHSDPVFIVGAGRSGTTLLYKLLCLNSGVSWISNYTNHNPRFSPLSIINNVSHYRKNLCRKMWFSKSSNAYFVDKKSIKRYFPFPVEGENVYRHCKIPALENEPWQISEDQKRCIVSTFRSIRQYQRGKVLVTKRTANNRRIPQLRSAFVNAKFIHIIRDGRAVSRSLINVKWWDSHKVWWMNKMPAMVWERQGNRPIALAAKNWVNEITAIFQGLRAVDSKNIMEVRYEDLSDNFKSIFRNIEGFLNLPEDRLWEKQLAKITIANRNRPAMQTKKGAPRDDDDLVQTIQGDMLRELGYI